ncbi:MAG TPA: RNA polymerase sigma factor, partial [Solirubrobacteraceae bacterium]|nr:RNA polymerase sigma factor [Solirubrobacteraceae bacterium]
MPGLRSPAALLRLQSDERLIALIRRGQHAAFETLFARYQSRLLAFCRHMLGSKEDAEDVLQEVFAAAFNAILADEREINVRPWLYRIARNRSLNHLRKASAIGVDSMDVHYAENGVSTADKVMRRESFRQLIGDVQELAETQRTALLLREIDALSYEQIADAMETTVPAVKSLLVRARISLAEAAEARKLTCDEARLELGEVAEGLLKTSPAVRRHVRDCERCRAFKKHLKDNNVALAAVLPVGPLLLLKKLVLTKLGSTAGAGGAHVAGAGGAGAAAGAGAVGGAGATSGFVTAGVGALATKAVAGLAVAAIVTAGTVEADRTAGHSHRHHHAATVSSVASVAVAPEPVVAHSISQPVTVSVHGAAASQLVAERRRRIRKAKAAVPVSPPSTTVAALTPPPPPPTTPVASNPKPPVTEVTTDSTQLPSGQAPSGPPMPAEATTTATTATPPPTTTTTTTTT